MWGHGFRFVVALSAMGFVCAACAGRAEEPSGSGGAMQGPNGGAGGGGASCPAKLCCATTRCCDPRTGQAMAAICGASGEAICPKSDGYIALQDVCMMVQSGAVACPPAPRLDLMELSGKACVPGSPTCEDDGGGTDHCSCICDADSAVWECTCTV